MKRVLMALALLLAVAGPARAQLSPMNAAGITYGHVHLNVSDLEVQKKLWVDMFGGTFVQKGPLTAVKFPNMLIAFLMKAPTGPSQGTIVDHFGFKVRSMPEMLAAVRAAGYEVQSEFTGAEGFPNAYVLGPDGLRLEMQEDKTMDVKARPNHIHFFTPEFEIRRLTFLLIEAGISPARVASVPLALTALHPKDLELPLPLGAVVRMGTTRFRTGERYAAVDISPGARDGDLESSSLAASVVACGDCLPSDRAKKTTMVRS